jgi:hypothetical protein
MFVLEDKICPGMVEIADPFDGMKGDFVMALCAVLTKLILVDILMAILATPKFYSGKFLEPDIVFCYKRMTFHTCDSLMCTG